MGKQLWLITETKQPSLSWSPNALVSHRVPILLQLSCRCSTTRCYCHSGDGEAGLQSYYGTDTQIHNPAWHSSKYHHSYALCFPGAEVGVLSWAGLLYVQLSLHQGEVFLPPQSITCVTSPECTPALTEVHPEAWFWCCSWRQWWPMQSLSKKITFFAKRSTRKQQFCSALLGTWWKAQLWPGPGDSLVHSKVEIPSTCFLPNCHTMMHWFGFPSYR